MISIKKGIVVSMRYIMRNSKGVVLEDTINAAPVRYLHGADQIHPHLQTQLEGMRIGDQKMVYLPKENGVSDVDFSFEVVICAVRNALPEELESGRAMQIENIQCGADCNCNQ